MPEYTPRSGFQLVRPAKVPGEMFQRFELAEALDVGGEAEAYLVEFFPCAAADGCAECDLDACQTCDLDGCEFCDEDACTSCDHADSCPCDADFCHTCDRGASYDMCCDNGNTCDQCDNDRCATCDNDPCASCDGDQCQACDLEACGPCDADACQTCDATDHCIICDANDWRMNEDVTFTVSDPMRVTRGGAPWPRECTAAGDCTGADCGETDCDDFCNLDGGV